MNYTVLTLFPEIVDAFFATSIMAKAIHRGVIGYRSINIRDFATDKHHKCDDAPYGGGAGMLMLPEPLGRALEYAGAQKKLMQAEAQEAPNRHNKRARVVYLSPSGRLFDQDLARELATEQELILLCGRYEGIDQRIIDSYVDDEISIGDYVLSSGEVGALVLIDATYRLVEGVISAESLEEESFSDGLLEYPQYTRPEIYDMLRVPEVLLSGHHEQIRRWRLRKRVEKTLLVRPDLIAKGLAAGRFSAETRKLIQELQIQSSGGQGAAEFEGDTDERN
ncbi:tRNA (guanosine(37)-N1)-methyltransferase TrmD [Gracilinema caldarium]|uniref:tRNA (guanosine(37)-N1)-methyltransferase TrmD n=1 Tax=Gracilinema caldarium TaxID=215591 RepID=UPI0026EB4E85|nr:tRNA (guanosine(37)-N1)-methyltransferase TrmD [Gracilinema caldarium]